VATAAISIILQQSDKARAVDIIGDKTPDNVRFFPVLTSLFPRAKFVHIVRDGRDCTVSAWFHNLRIDAALLTRQYPTFHAFADYYARIWTGNVSVGANFAAERPQLCLSLRYEDLVADPPTVFGQVCGFLGASCDPVLLDACLNATDFARLSGGRQRGQEDRDSFFRRGVPGDWRTHFDATADAAFRANTHPWLSSFGYQ
jgi:hypothetical protein